MENKTIGSARISPVLPLSGKKALVTGGRKGNLGPIWVETLKAFGVEVRVLDLPDNDITQPSSVWTWDIHGYTPDIIINNAAIDPKPSDKGGGFWRYDDVVDVNLKGALNVCAHFIPAMIRSGGGVIINIGSIMGNIAADFRNYPPGFDKAVGYNVSKAALIQLSRSIAVQYGQHNIRAVTISFGPYDSGLPEDFKKKFLANVPLGRCVSKESLRATLIYAITCPELTGQQILVDGGYISL